MELIIRLNNSIAQLLPPPFAWKAIPAGSVALEKGGYILDKGQTFDVPPFAIAQYPITNSQFAKFIEAGGYTDRTYWTNNGWQRKEEKNWTGPRYLDDAEWNGADYPVVGVSWYEALAFCQWLSAATSENITLPTEQQWQRAAQGDEEYFYPWGNEFDPTHCNADSGTAARTTPVTQYPDGASPYGVMDMVGNVWEWCLTDYMTGKTDNGDDYQLPPKPRRVAFDMQNAPKPGDANYHAEDFEPVLYGPSRVIRGASFYDNRFVARTAARYLSTLDERGLEGYLGFRVVCNITLR